MTLCIFLKGIFLRIALKKFPIKNKLTTSDLYSLGLLFLVCTSSDQQKSINILEDHSMNIPTKVGSNGRYMTQWFQRRLRGRRARMVVGFITIQSVPITTNIVSLIPTRLKTRYGSNRNRTLHEWSLGDSL